MADPVIWWDPARLRSIGFVLGIVGASVIATHSLDGVRISDRERLLLAGTLAVSGYYGLRRFPQLTDLITLVSVALAVLIPLGLSVSVVRDLVSG